MNQFLFRLVENTFPPGLLQKYLDFVFRHVLIPLFQVQPFHQKHRREAEKIDDKRKESRRDIDDRNDPDSRFFPVVDADVLRHKFPDNEGNIGDENNHDRDGERLGKRLNPRKPGKKRLYSRDGKDTA